jgi:folate-binding protein YgfZ
MGTWLSDRALIRIAGDDPRDFLQGLVTGDMRGGLPVWAGLLSPQGKALFDFIVWPDGETLLIDCEAAVAEALSRRLAMYRLRRPITIEAADGGVHWAAEGSAGVPDPRLVQLGRRWLGEAAGKPATGWREHRLALGVTEGRGELGDGETLWLEANAGELNGVSFTKGCYVGQENTARMHHRAKVNRRLIVAPLGEPGDRTRASYPELGLMVELRRVEALGDAVRPAWLERVLAQRPIDE